MLKQGTAQDLGVISNGEFRIIIKDQGFEMITSQRGVRE